MLVFIKTHSQTKAGTAIANLNPEVPLPEQLRGGLQSKVSGPIQVSKMTPVRPQGFPACGCKNQRFPVLASGHTCC